MRRVRGSYPPPGRAEPSRRRPDLLRHALAGADGAVMQPFQQVEVLVPAPPSVDASRTREVDGAATGEWAGLAFRPAWLDGYSTGTTYDVRVTRLVCGGVARCRCRCRCAPETGDAIASRSGSRRRSPHRSRTPRSAGLPGGRGARLGRRGCGPASGRDGGPPGVGVGRRRRVPDVECRVSSTGCPVPGVEPYAGAVAGLPGGGARVSGRRVRTPAPWPCGGRPTWRSCGRRGRVRGTCR